MKLTALFKEFTESEKSAGILLLACTAISLLLSNSSFQDSWISIWNYEFSSHTVTHWINDGLMTIFFLLIGLELEREIYAGELSSIKSASLPAIAALGGMIVPAGIFLLFNFGKPSQAGAGIPMATDIAFAVGILSLAGNKIPVSLKVFLTALAVIDDLGAIIVIALFYTSTLLYSNLCISIGIFALLIILNRMKVYNLFPYLIGGVIMWYFMLHSGIHATITGVLLAFALPFGKGDKESPSYILQHFLHKPVAFVILPLFAIANTCLIIGNNWHSELLSSNSIGIICGLTIGKPIGIFLFSLLAVTSGIASLPSELKWKHIIGAGCLGGIGFTMSLFITLLAFNDNEYIDGSKMAILFASLLSGLTGFLILKTSNRN